MRVKIRAFESKTKGVEAIISIALDDTIFISNILLRHGANGEFLSYPSYKSGEEYKNHVFAKKEFNKLILDNYVVGDTVIVEHGNSGTENNKNNDKDEEEFPFN